MIALVMVISIVLSACAASVSQSQAEGIALEFIKQNVKFFTKGDNASSLVDEVTVPTATSYKEGDVWVIAVHVSTVVEGIEKKNDLIVKVDEDGKVVEFNGQKVGNA